MTDKDLKALDSGSESAMTRGEKIDPRVKHEDDVNAYSEYSSLEMRMTEFLRNGFCA